MWASERGAHEQVQRDKRPGKRTRTSNRAVSRVGGRASGDRPGDSALKPSSIFFYNKKKNVAVSLFLSFHSSIINLLLFSSLLSPFPLLSILPHSLVHSLLRPSLPVHVYHQKIFLKMKKMKKKKKKTRKETEKNVLTEKWCAK